MSGKEETPEISLCLSTGIIKSHVKIQKEGNCLKATKRGFTRNQTCPYLDPDVLASRTVRK